MKCFKLIGLLKFFFTSTLLYHKKKRCTRGFFFLTEMIKKSFEYVLLKESSNINYGNVGTGLQMTKD